MGKKIVLEKISVTEVSFYKKNPLFTIQFFHKSEAIENSWNLDMTSRHLYSVRIFFLKNQKDPPQCQNLRNNK
jgi:hypothetical protein